MTELHNKLLEISHLLGTAISDKEINPALAKLLNKKISQAINFITCCTELPSKDDVNSYLKKYACKEMTEYKPDELICFTSGALTLLRWLEENKIK